jgi:hypothetical protein
MKMTACFIFCGVNIHNNTGLRSEYKSIALFVPQPTGFSCYADPDNFTVGIRIKDKNDSNVSSSQSRNFLYA